MIPSGILLCFALLLAAGAPSAWASAAQTGPAAELPLSGKVAGKIGDFSNRLPTTSGFQLGLGVNGMLNSVKNKEAHEQLAALAFVQAALGEAEELAQAKDDVIRNFPEKERGDALMAGSRFSRVAQALRTQLYADPAQAAIIRQSAYEVWRLFEDSHKAKLGDVPAGLILEIKKLGAAREATGASTPLVRALPGGHAVRPPKDLGLSPAPAAAAASPAGSPAPNAPSFSDKPASFLKRRWNRFLAWLGFIDKNVIIPNSAVAQVRFPQTDVIRVLEESTAPYPWRGRVRRIQVLLMEDPITRRYFNPIPRPMPDKPRTWREARVRYGETKVLIDSLSPDGMLDFAFIRDRDAALRAQRPEFSATLQAYNKAMSADDMDAAWEMQQKLTKLQLDYLQDKGFIDAKSRKLAQRKIDAL